MGILKSARQQHSAMRRRAARVTSSAVGAPAGLPRFLRRNPDTAADGAPPAESCEPRLANKPADWASRHDLPPCCNELDDAKAFAHGSYGPKEVIGGGGLGGFTGWYFPFDGSGVLHIVEAGAVLFKNLLVASGGTVQPHPDLPATAALSALAARIQALPEPDRTNTLSGYQWTTAEQTAWLADLERVVERAWGFQHSFFLNRPCWDWMGADVNVDVRLHTGAKTGDDHMDIESYKTPAGESLRTFEVSHQVSHGSGTASRDQSMRLASTTTGEKEIDLLRESVEFDHDSDVLTGAAQTRLRNFIRQYNGATSHAAWSRARIDLIGHTSSSGSDAYNQDLSERREQAVRTFLESNGLSDAPIRIHDDARGEREADQTTDAARDRRVDLLVDGGQRMVTASHEFGHAFGLGDEYATSSAAIGDDATHHGIARQMTDERGSRLPGAAVEHSGGIMSFGNEVRPQHYATFHHALEELTGKSPWSLGAHRNLADTETVCSGGMPPCTGDTCVAANTPRSGEGSSVDPRG